MWLLVTGCCCSFSSVWLGNLQDLLGSGSSLTEDALTRTNSLCSPRRKCLDNRIYRPAGLNSPSLNLLRPKPNIGYHNPVSLPLSSGCTITGTDLNLCERSRRWALKHIPDPNNGEIRVWGDGAVRLLGCAPSVSSDLRGAAPRLASPRLPSLPFSIRTSLDASLRLASMKGWGEEGEGAASHGDGEAAETGKSKWKEWEGMEMTEANTKS